MEDADHDLDPCDPEPQAQGMNAEQQRWDRQTALGYAVQVAGTNHLTDGPAIVELAEAFYAFIGG